MTETEERGPHWTRATRTYEVGPVRGDSFVPAPRQIDLPRLDSAPMDVSGVWQPAGTIQEIGTPVSRALATVIRSAPLLILALPVSIALAWWLGARLWQWALLWAGLSVAAYLAILWLDLVFNSPSAAERHRVNAATGLKRMELRHAQELRRAIVEAYLDHLDGDGGR